MKVHHIIVSYLHTTRQHHDTLAKIIRRIVEISSITPSSFIKTASVQSLLVHSLSRALYRSYRINIFSTCLVRSLSHHLRNQLVMIFLAGVAVVPPERERDRIHSISPRYNINGTFMQRRERRLYTRRQHTTVWLIFETQQR